MKPNFSLVEMRMVLSMAGTAARAGRSVDEAMAQAEAFAASRGRRLGKWQDLEVRQKYWRTREEARL